MRARTVAVLLLLVATTALVVALLAGRSANVALPSPSPTASASPTPSPTAMPTAGPSASPSPSPTSAVLSDRYGYVIPAQGRLVVRPETSQSSVVATPGENASVSHDGRRIAFWRTGPQGDGAHRLLVVEVATGAERALFTAPAGVLGGTIVWSNDGTGLLVSLHSRESVVGSGPRSSELMSYDLTAAQAPGATEGALRRTDGRVFVPLGWDKAAQLAFALVTGEGGFAAEYVTWDKRTLPAGQQPVRRAPVPWPVLFSTVVGSPDGKTVLAVDLAANALRFWPAANIGQASFIQRGGERVYDARWRPDSRDVVWIAGSEVRVTTYQTDAERVIYRGDDAMSIASLRADGSAALVRRGERIVVVEIASGRSADLPAPAPLLGQGVLLR